MRNMMIVAGFLAVASPCTKERVHAPDTLAIKGTLTSEGVECPAMRGDDGVLYTLAGSLGNFRPGDKVCVRGKRAEVSYCMQGITVTVESIAAASQCP
jgi:hypothetical protein